MISNYISQLKLALEKRKSLFDPEQQEKTNAFRLCDGSFEGIPGLVIDKYASTVIFQVFENSIPLSLDEIRSLAIWLIGNIGIRSVYLKDFIKDRSYGSQKQLHYESEAFAGEASESEIICRENGCFFEIHPYDGFSCGLFLDQRNNRRFISEKTNQKTRLLNLFSYTCAFSVMGALKGARTTSVDLSKKALDWGKRNFQLNGLAPQDHSFYAEDVFDFIKRASKRGEEFDLVVMDPPSFSRGKGTKVWSIKKDYLKLIERVVPLVANKGRIFFSCNLSDWNSESLWESTLPVLKNGINHVGEWKRELLPHPPLDFETGSRLLSQWAAVRL